MKTISFRLFILSAILVCAVQLHATWSIIVVDTQTKQVGIAAASCSPGVYGISAAVPGKGVVIVQAMSNNNARYKGYQLMVSGASPKQILEAMMDPNFDPENQQYAVISLNDPGNAQVYTGKKAHDSKGSVTGDGISVQGNTLVSDNELQAVYDAAVKARKENRSMEEILMLALEAGAKLGGDKRCGERKASSSYLTVYKATDTIQQPWLNLIVSGSDASPDKNAVELLRGKFEEWKKGR